MLDTQSNNVFGKSDLNENSNSVYWEVIFKNHYYSRLETKLQSFQIKLNFQAIVTNLTLDGIGIRHFDLLTSFNCFTETLLH